MKIAAISAIVLGLVSLSLSGCLSQADSQEVSSSESEGESGHHEHKIVVTTPVRKNVISTVPYVCQIHSCQHIEIRALEGGYLQKIGVKEGQAVKKGTLLFKILPILYQAKMESEDAEVQRLQIELENAQALLSKNYVAPPEIALKKAELAKAKAKLSLAQAELDLTSVTAPFDGIVDRQRTQLGSLIEEGDVLTTFSDNSKMWVYFNVPEARYLEYKAELDKDDGHADHLQIELKLANGKIFPQKGKIGAIEADFNNTTGNIAFRADFPNPGGLLRNGQTGTVLVRNTLKNVVVIPQRAKFDILARPYVYVVDKDHVVHQRDIMIHKSVQDDVFVIEKGLDEHDKIILEGIRQVRDGDKIEYEFLAPEQALSNLKYHAE
jgi:membrane fusion protein (multidrug efflux system)